MDFDPVAVSELNEKKVAAAAVFLLSEVKIRSILDNSRHVRKVIQTSDSESIDIFLAINYWFHQ